MIRSWSRLKSGRPSSSSATTSPSTIACRASIHDGRREQPREVRLRVVAVAGEQADLAVGDDRLDAVAVPLDLEQPVLVAERLGREGRLHRLEVARHRRLFRAREVDLRGRGRRLADPDRGRVRLDLVVGAAGLDALRVVLGVPAGDGVGVALVDQQPLLALVILERRARRAAGPAARAHDREPAAHLLAVDPELELALRDRRAGVGGLVLGLPRAPVPDDDVAGAVLLGRDHALEVEVLDRVVLDVDGHPPDVGVERRALGHGPRHEDAVDLEAEVVVEPGRAVALDDEPAARAERRRPGRRSRGPAPASSRSRACGGIPRAASPRVCRAPRRRPGRRPAPPARSGGRRRRRPGARGRGTARRTRESS